MFKQMACFFENIFSKNRSSQQRCSVKKGVLRNFTKFAGKHLCLSPAILLKKRLWNRCFTVNFVKFLRTPFLQNIFGSLLLDVTGISCEKRQINNAMIYSLPFHFGSDRFPVICYNISATVAL